MRDLVAAAVIVVAGCGQPAVVSSPPPSPSPSPSGTLAAAATPTPSAPSNDNDDDREEPAIRLPKAIRSGTANDDFPHRTLEMRSRLGTAQTCVPRGLAVPHDEPGSDAIELVADSLGPDLVVCAQGLTRRDVSVFFDEVNYACWNLDPKTGFLARRKDLGRSWFDCRDGSCTAGMTEAVSHDGKLVVSGGESIKVTERGGTRVVASFPRPSEIASPDWLRGSVELVSNVLFVAAADHVYVYDPAGKQLATLAGNRIHVVSDKLVLAVKDALHADAYDLGSRRTSHIALPGCTAEELDRSDEDRGATCNRALVEVHLEDAIDHMGVRYAIDNATRKLLLLDPKTFRSRSAKQLAICN